MPLKEKEMFQPGFQITEALLAHLGKTGVGPPLRKKKGKISHEAHGHFRAPVLLESECQAGASDSLVGKFSLPSHSPTLFPSIGIAQSHISCCNMN